MKKGFTLIELLVYMLIVGIIVVFAGQAFSDSTKFRVRSQNMLKATQEAENVATLFKADVAQMGAKSAKEDGSSANGDEHGDKFSSTYKHVYMNPKEDGVLDENVDSSSFLLSAEGGFSSLTFRRVRYDALGLYQAVEEVKWFVENEQLKRICRTIDGVELENICPAGKSELELKEFAVEIATGVKDFVVVAPKPVTEAEVQAFPSPTDKFRLIPRTGLSNIFNFSSTGDGDEVNGPGETITLSGFITNYDNANNKLKDDHTNINQAFAVNEETLPGEGNGWKEYCNNRGVLNLKKDNTYEISFEIPFTSMHSDYDVQPFVPGEDHMAVGFRGKESGEVIKDANGNKLLEDFLFYPPYNADGSGKRFMRFTVPADIDTVCLAFTFACYSPIASQASLKIKNLKLKKIAGLNYDFETPYDPEGHKNDKKNIKALKMKLQIARGGKNGENGETGEIEIVVPTPSNGPRD